MDSSHPQVGHVPVMVAEVLAGLITTTSGLYIDGTLGLGGHAAALLDHLSPEGSVLGIELDPQALTHARQRLAHREPRVIFRRGSYGQIPRFLSELGVGRCRGVLLDLGISSYTLESSGRGFSFQADEPLDMRFNPGEGQPLSRVLPRFSQEKLADILYEYGEERRSRPLARAILQAARTGNMATSGDLARTVRSIARGPHATKTLARVFQALRIFINQELDTLKTTLDRLAGVLVPGGRIAIISFHSLEDRLVKQFFAREAKDCLCDPRLPTCQCGHQATFKVLTRKPISPSPDELARNPRSRSAKLRIMERL